jgi:hypothetical protein
MVEITTIELGRPGPAGVGITAAEKNALAPKASPTFTGTATFNGDVALGDSTTRTISITGHIDTLGSAPSITANASAGTGRTASIVRGNDTSGLIRLNTGTSAGPGLQFTVTFNVARPTANYQVLLQAADVDAAALQFYVNESTSTTGGFGVHFITDPPDSTSFDFYYWIIE